jgi:hypothetical protein
MPRVHLKPKRRKANQMSHKQSQSHVKRKITDPPERTNIFREKNYRRNSHWRAGFGRRAAKGDGHDKKNKRLKIDWQLDWLWMN